MGHFFRTRSLFSCIIVSSVAIILSADGGSITWFEPPPFETVTDDSSISAANNKSVVKGSFNEELSCNFSLSADLRINTVFMKFDGTNVAIFAPGQQAPTVVPGFANRFNATWVPNQLKLIMLSVTDATEGEYRCEVLSLGGSIQTWSRTIHVSVLVPPSITEISGKDVTEGENVTLKCSADGKPTPSIEWMRLPDNIVVLMPLIDINRHDLRKYRCTADNGVGTPATRDVIIDVKYPVEAIGMGGNTTIAEAGAKNFSCPVDGNPQPSITWYKGSEVGGGKISSEKQLTVKVNSGENVCYSCLANNSLGTVTITQCLIVQEPSTAPTYPTSAPVGSPGTVIGIVAGVVVAMAIVIIGLVAWWVHKKRKSRNTKQGEMQYLEVENKDSLLEKTLEA